MAIVGKGPARRSSSGRHEQSVVGSSCSATSWAVYTPSLINRPRWSLVKLRIAGASAIPASDGGGGGRTIHDLLTVKVYTPLPQRGRVANRARVPHSKFSM